MTDPVMHTLSRDLRRSRRPDVAAGLLLAAELVRQLPDIPLDYARVITIALQDAAAEIYEQADDELLVELLANPDGEWVDEDHLDHLTGEQLVDEHDDLGYPTGQEV